MHQPWSTHTGMKMEANFSSQHKRKYRKNVFLCQALMVGRTLLELPPCFVFFCKMLGLVTHQHSASQSRMIVVWENFTVDLGLPLELWLLKSFWLLGENTTKCSSLSWIVRLAMMKMTFYMSWVHEEMNSPDCLYFVCSRMHPLFTSTVYMCLILLYSLSRNE